MKPIILASASPRRREICDLLGLCYTVEPALTEPEVCATLPPKEAVLQVARHKAEEVAAKHNGEIVLGADTVVEIDDELLGKPSSPENAAAMLRRLSGKTHRVITAVWVCDGEHSEGFYDSAAVEFMPMSEEEITAYVQSGEPMDKAGAYAIQGQGMRYIRGIHGDFYTVMGLPSGRLYEFLKNHC
ncbi:MAG: septum formation protein Maf [Clostridia bacterium]|jgi:septum formation protein|nr:septum formation protein Maf [Clostridia bacterium]